MWSWTTGLTGLSIASAKNVGAVVFEEPSSGLDSSVSHEFARHERKHAADGRREAEMEHWMDELAPQQAHREFAGLCGHLNLSTELHANKTNRHSNPRKELERPASLP